MCGLWVCVYGGINLMWHLQIALTLISFFYAPVSRYSCYHRLALLVDCVANWHLSQLNYSGCVELKLSDVVTECYIKFYTTRDNGSACANFYWHHQNICYKWISIARFYFLSCKHNMGIFFVSCFHSFEWLWEWVIRLKWTNKSRLQL